MDEALLLALASQGGGGGGGGGEANLVETTWRDLVTLRDDGELVPGTFYRITDFVTKLNGTYEDNSMYIHYAKSAEHPYDIIVRADSETKLNENAWAAHHDGDTYFARSNLAAWELKYDLDNDPTKYMWADPENGKGVVFYMKDEFNNEAWYDFKNVMYLRYALKSKNNKFTQLAYSNITESRYASMFDLYQLLSGRQIFCGEYTFYVDLLTIIGAVQEPVADDNYLTTYNAGWYYTFNFVGGGYFADASLGHEGIVVRNNKQAFCIDYAANTLFGAEIQGLPQNVIELTSALLDTCSNNVFNSGAVFNTLYNATSCHFDDGAYNNTLGDGASNIHFGRGSYSNVLENACDNIRFGADCSQNIIGSASDKVFFADYCYDNIFEGPLWCCNFGNNCYGLNVEPQLNYCVFDGECFYIKLTSTGNMTVNYYHFANNICGNAPNNPLAITANPGRTYVTNVAKTSLGVLKTWCEADLAP